MEHYLSIRGMNSPGKVAGLWPRDRLVEEAMASVPIETRPKIQRREFPVVSIKIGPSDGE